MIRIALKGMVERRVRTTLTAVAIVLGVAMVSGAFVVSDTMRSAADSLSSASYSGTDAVVDARTAFNTADAENATAPTVSAALLQRVRQVPQVQAAVGDVTDLNTKLIGKDGKVVGTGPYFGVGLDAASAAARRLTPFHLTTGRFATGRDEVVIGLGAAKDEGWKVGDRVQFQGRGPVRSFTVTGIAKFGSVEKLGTATFGVFDLKAAQELTGRGTQFDSILVDGKPGVSRAALQTALANAIPPSARVRSAAAQDRFTLDGLKQFISIIKTVLLAFGFVAIFVGAFTIFNTLSITVAQRSRELALLRAMGSSRRQVLGSVAFEALVLGIGASAIGLFAGLGLGAGLTSVMSALGIDLPQAGTVFSARTVVVSLLVGSVVTLLAGLGPALRATRVSPVTAMREGAEIPPGRIGRHARKIAAGVLAVALALLGFGLFGGGMQGGERFALIGPGVLLLFVGVALMSPRLVAPLASVLGAPARRLGGVAGGLARGNAMRNPGRTAVTSSALMIGIALVTFVAVIGQGVRASTVGALQDQIRADYVVTGNDGYHPIDPKVRDAVVTAPGVRLVTGIKQDTAKSYGAQIGVNGVDPAAIGQVYRFHWKAGSSDASLAALGRDGAIVSESYASDHHLRTGSRFTVTPANGTSLRLVVRGIEAPSKFDPLNLGEVTVSEAVFTGAFETQLDRLAFVRTGGANASVTKALNARLATFPDAKVSTASAFAHDQMAWVDMVLGLFYVLLALAVVVSLFGIVNTLALSVLERTRELGMLRAIGMSRRQVRRMVRYESVITTLIGAAVGIAVGMFLAALVTVALADYDLVFAVPVSELVAFALVAAEAGVLAAIVPARRAARLDPLTALAYE